MRLLKAIFWIGLVALFMPRERDLGARHSAHDRSELSATISDAPAFVPPAWQGFEGRSAGRTVDEYLAALRARLEALRLEIEDQQRTPRRMHALASPVAR